MTPDERAALAENLLKMAAEFDERAERQKRSQMMWPAALDAEARAKVCREAAAALREPVGERETLPPCPYCGGPIQRSRDNEWTWDYCPDCGEDVARTKFATTGGRHE